MSLAVGSKLGPYEILAPIGAGGMGEVYRAKDGRLKRDVALKVLPEAFSHDPERMVRFQREAEVLASLNHPNIAHIYGVEEQALVMELVEGESPKGPMPFDEAWHIASQIAAALEFAHDKGIVHRDLKPANVKVTPEGVVKLLDFGLARAFTTQREGSASANLENSPTLTIGATEVGVILGTAAYMAPEQARGKSLDKRADIWAFGVVFYELLTGRRLFQGEDVSETLAQLLTKEPDLTQASPRAQKLLRRCLQKDPKQRLRDIGEARFLLDDAPYVLAAPRRKWLWPAVAATLAVALGLVLFLHFHETAPEPALMRFEIPNDSVANYLALSPDGRQLAFVRTDNGVQRLYLRSLDNVETHAVPESDGATYPFWSPDSHNLGFFAEGKLKRIVPGSGRAQTICDAPNSRGGTWNSEDVILFAPDIYGPIYRVSAAGGVSKAVTKAAAGGESHRYPEFISGGRKFLFNSQQGKNTALLAGDLDGSAPVVVLPGASTRGQYVPVKGKSGLLLFRRDEALVVQSFDPAKLQLSGEPVVVEDRVALGGHTGFGAFSRSLNGILVYRTGTQVPDRQLVWLDRAGRNLEKVGTPGPFEGLALSPDEKRIAVTLRPSDVASDIWVKDVGTGIFSRFTNGPGRIFGAVWSPDGGRLAYALFGIGSAFSVKAAAGGKEEGLGHHGANGNLNDWSPDGKYLVYDETGLKTQDDLWLLPLEGNHKPMPLVQTPADEFAAQFSPDGRWLAYVSNESGRSEIWVQPMPPNGTKSQVSTTGGAEAHWRRDGKELFYISADRKLMAVPVMVGKSFEHGAPKELFGDVPFINSDGTTRYWFSYAPSADGQRFLGLVPGGKQAGAAPLTLVVNWLAGLKK
jgi:serine/threonine protein kinase